MFSAPLFCHIQSLVNGLSKKNQRSCLSELHQVCDPKLAISWHGST